MSTLFEIGLGVLVVLGITRRISFMLSGAQLGITVTGLLVGYVAEPMIGDGIGELLGGAGVPTGAGIVLGTILALLFATVVQMVFGELFPKNLAIARPEPVARALGLSTPIHAALRAMREGRNHIALVADGGTPLGLVTMHDLLDRLLPAT